MWQKQTWTLSPPGPIKVAHAAASATAIKLQHFPHCQGVRVAGSRVAPFLDAPPTSTLLDTPEEAHRHTKYTGPGSFLP